MIAQWVGEVAGIMRVNKIKSEQLAKKLGYRREYISMILNGHREPAGAEQKIRAALDELIKGA